MITHITKSSTFLFLIFFPFSCNFQNEETPANLDFNDLSMDGIDVGLKSSYNYTYKDQKDLENILHDLWSEGTEAVAKEKLS